MIESMLIQNMASGENPAFPVPPLSEFKKYYDHPDEDKFVGYYNTLGYQAYISAESLINECKLNNVATMQTRYPNWMKFFIDGKIIAIAQTPIASNVSWDELNERGLVYGEKIITISGKKYKVRLLKTLAEGDRYELPPNTALDNQKPFYTVGSEYNRTILNMVNNSQQPGERNQGEAPWENYNGAMLTGKGLTGIYLSYVWMQEFFLHSDGRNGRIQRPSLNVTDNIAHAWFNPPTPEVPAYKTGACWRPVLELVNG